MTSLSFNRLFEESIRKYWDRPALSDYGGRTLTYGQAAREILLLQAFFRRCSIRPGEKIALVGTNSVNWALVYLAAVTSGAVIVPVLPEFGDEDVEHIISHSESVILFAAADRAARIEEGRLGGLRTVVSLDTLEPLYSRCRRPPEGIPRPGGEEAAIDSVTAETFSLPPGREENEPASLVYTSGTSGFSKGALLPYRSLLANINFARENMRLRMAERILGFLPLAHAYAASFDFLFPFSVGCHVTFLGRMPSPKVLLEAFAEVRPSLILFVPLILEKLYKKRIAPQLRGPAGLLLRLPVLSALVGKKINRKLTSSFGGNFQEIVVGGASLNREVELFLKKIKLPVTVGYGMTECGPLISYSPWDEHRAGSVGRPISGLECRIDSPDPSRVPGEIVVRGPGVMLGYYRNREATREVLSEDGRLRTGDLGTIDGDGFLYIRGRSKNMILGPSGQNVYPEEIESRLSVMPYVQEALVIDNNGRLTALVYPDWEAVDGERAGEEDSREWIRERMEENRAELNRRLPAYSRLAAIRLHGEAFEKTPTHKIKRYRYIT